MSSDRELRVVRPWRAVRTRSTVRLPVSVAPPLPPEASRHYWHPDRPGARLAPEDFRRKLHAVSPDLEAVWHPLRERWQVWCRAPRVRETNGWLLLFAVERWPDGAYQPLDERVLAQLWEQSARKWGGARQYWERVQAEMARDRERLRRQREDERNAVADDWYRFGLPKVGYGPSNGSKFATCQA